MKKVILNSILLMTTLVMTVSCSDDKKASGSSGGNSSELCKELSPINNNGYAYQHQSQQGYQHNSMNFNIFVDRSGRYYNRHNNVYTAQYDHNIKLTCNEIMNSNQNCSHVRFDNKFNEYYDHNTNKTLATYDRHTNHYIKVGTSDKFYCTQHQSFSGYQNGTHVNAEASVHVRFDYSSRYESRGSHLCTVAEGCWHGGPVQYRQAFTHKGQNFKSGYYPLFLLATYGIIKALN